MQVKTIRAMGIGLVALLWAVLTLCAWFGPDKLQSDAERRQLKQKPEFSAEAVNNGTYMKEFESYSLDQFPLRDGFRQIKALFHNYVMNYSDNNDLYIEKGYIVKQEYPLNTESVTHAVNRFNNVYAQMLRDNNCRVFLSVVPDKGYYLGEESGHLTPDYEAMIRQLQEGMPWATYIDITDTLSIEDYYRTDTHWRQEKLLPAAKRLCQAMGVKEPVDADYTVTAVDRPFYGVYYGQAALPVKAETLYYLYSEELSYCQVMDYEINKYTEVYNMNKLESPDLYDIYLSGPKGLLTIENPNAGNGKHLVIFRDSFGSSIAPLLVNGYSKVTLVDIRYLLPSTAARMVDFTDADVLFLYSTLVLNNSNTIK